MDGREWVMMDGDVGHVRSDKDGKRRTTVRMGGGDHRQNLRNLLRAGFSANRVAVNFREMTGVPL